MMIKKFLVWGIFVIGCLFCMIGGCALDSESLTVPMRLIEIGMIIAFFGYRGIRKAGYGKY